MSSLSTTTLLAFPKRYLRLLLLCIFGLGFFAFIGRRSGGRPYTDRQAIATSNTQEDPPVNYPEPQLEPENDQNKPPLFEAYRTYEDEVSRWNLAQFGKPTDRYIFFANHVVGSGWGNSMQEMVFHSLVASGSGRGYVYEDYTWERAPNVYSEFNGALIPSRVPLSTMIGGYLLGLPASQSNASGTVLPPSISRRLYDAICPESLRIFVSGEQVQRFAGDDVDLKSRSPGMDVLDAWLTFMDQPVIKSRKCVEVQRDTAQVFDIWHVSLYFVVAVIPNLPNRILNTPRVQSLLETLYKSPVMTHWSWSKLVLNLFERNIAHFVSARSLLNLDLASFFYTGTPVKIDDLEVASSLLHQLTEREDMRLPLLTLHLRRGDYEQHCGHLATYRSQYIGINMGPEFARDAFVPPEYSEGDQQAPNSTEGVEFVDSLKEMRPIYNKHCFPDVEQIKIRVRQVLRDYEAHLQEEAASARLFGSLLHQLWRWTMGRTRAKANFLVKKVYLMSNGDEEWLKQVGDALKADADRSLTARVPRLSNETAEWDFLWSWDEVSSSRDIVAGWEEHRVAQILDMYVAQRAELFIGNGFSTLTSNIVMLRKKNGFHPIQTRFW